jgi:hypothetical protein
VTAVEHAPMVAIGVMPLWRAGACRGATSPIKVLFLVLFYIFSALFVAILDAAIMRLAAIAAR